MKKIIAVPFVLLAAFGLSACSKQAETQNVSVNETSLNAEAPAADANLSDNAAEAPLDAGSNASNAADALTNG